MRVLGLLLIAMIWIQPVFADTDLVLGVYWFPDKDGQVEIFRDADGRYSGRVVRFDDPDETDDLNPDPTLRGQKFIGSLMFSGFEYATDKSRWENGTIYDASEGATYKARLWFEKNAPDVLQARGYIGVPLLGRTAAFHRVVPAAAAAQ